MRLFTAWFPTSQRIAEPLLDAGPWEVQPDGSLLDDNLNRAQLLARNQVTFRRRRLFFEEE